MHSDMPDALKPIARFHERGAALDAMRSLDRAALAAMDDKALAVWQTGYGLDSPQWRLGEHEWQSRLLARQIKAARYLAYMGIGGTLLGVVLGAWLPMAFGK